MYRNTVLFKWRKETTSQQKLEMRQRTAYLSFACPTVVALDFGENIGQDPTNFHFAVIFDFRDEEGWLAYDEPGQSVLWTAEVALQSSRPFEMSQ